MSHTIYIRIEFTLDEQAQQGVADLRSWQKPGTPQDFYDQIISAVEGWCGSGIKANWLNVFEGPSGRLEIASEPNGDTPVPVSLQRPTVPKAARVRIQQLEDQIEEMRKRIESLEYGLKTQGEIHGKTLARSKELEQGFRDLLEAWCIEHCDTQPAAREASGSTCHTDICNRMHDILETTKREEDSKKLLENLFGEIAEKVAERSDIPHEILDKAFRTAIDSLQEVEDDRDAVVEERDRWKRIAKQAMKRRGELPECYTIEPVDCDPTKVQRNRQAAAIEQAMAEFGFVGVHTGVGCEAYRYDVELPPGGKTGKFVLVTTDSHQLPQRWNEPVRVGRFRSADDEGEHQICTVREFIDQAKRIHPWKWVFPPNPPIETWDDGGPRDDFPSQFERWYKKKYVCGTLPETKRMMCDAWLTGREIGHDAGKREEQMRTFRSMTDDDKKWYCPCCGKHEQVGHDGGEHVREYLCHNCGYQWSV